jgi:chromosome segregation ATPase
MPNKYLLELEEKVQEQEETIATFKKDQSVSITVFKDQQKEINNLNTSLNKSEKQLSENKEKVKELTNKSKEQVKQLKELQAQIKDQAKELESYVNQQAQDLNQNKPLLKELTSYKEKNKQLLSQNNSLIEKYTQLENTCQSLNKSLSKQQQALISQQEKNQILEDKILELQDQAQNNFATDSYTSSKEVYKEKILEWETEKENILATAEQARNEQAEQIAELEKENNQLDTELNQAVDLLESKDKTIGELQQKNQELNKTLAELKTQGKTKENIKPESIETFLCSECGQTKPSQELSRQFRQFSFCLECSKKARKEAQKEKQPLPTDFTCHLCEQAKQEVPTKMKLDKTLADYSICSTCKPTAKEFNEAELITDELWEKYPYSSASEILELEFGIVRK